MKEDEYQGKAGLVLAMRTSAFVSDDNHNFMGVKAEVGDWIAAWVTDGRKIVDSRSTVPLFHDDHVRMVIPQPDWIL